MSSELVYPYSLGLYLATNAVGDARLVIDGPTCCFYRVDFIQGNHDMTSDLLDCCGRHRVLNTNADIDNIVLDRSDQLREILENLGRDSQCGCIFLAALPMTFITGMPYQQIADELANTVSRPIMIMPHKSLQCDWLTGYSDALVRLAEVVDIANGKPALERVAVVGHFMDRTEADQLANLAEIERLLRAMSLQPVSTWLSGQDFSTLCRVADAGTIVSLPHGRSAARILAERTGARLVEGPLPWGLAATREWVQQVGRATGREEQAAKLVADESRLVARRLEWLLPNGFVGKRLAAVLDPNLIAGFADLVRDLGAELVFAKALGRAAEADDVPNLDMVALGQEIEQALDDGGLDLAIGPAPVLGSFISCDVPVLEFGFPAHSEHCLCERPYLGFRGALALTERMYNRMQLFALLET